MQETLSLKGLFSFIIVKDLNELFDIILANFSPKLSVNLFDLISRFPLNVLFFIIASNNSFKCSILSI